MQEPMRNSDETWQDVLRFTSDCQGYSAIWQSWEPRMRYYDIVYWFWWNSLEIPENRDVSNQIQQLLRRARMLRRSSTAKAGSLSYMYPVKCPHWSNASACGWTTPPNISKLVFQSILISKVSQALLGSACDAMWHGSTVRCPGLRKRWVSAGVTMLDHVDNNWSCWLDWYWVIGVWKSHSLEVLWSCSDLIIFVGCFCSTPSSFCKDFQGICIQFYSWLFKIVPKSILNFPKYTHIILFDMFCPFL